MGYFKVVRAMFTNLHVDSQGGKIKVSLMWWGVGFNERKFTMIGIIMLYYSLCGIE